MSTIRNSLNCTSACYVVCRTAAEATASNKSVAIANRLLDTVTTPTSVLGECANSHSVDSLSHLPFLLNPLLRGAGSCSDYQDNSDRLWASLRCTCKLGHPFNCCNGQLTAKKRLGHSNQEYCRYRNRRQSVDEEGIV